MDRDLASRHKVAGRAVIAGLLLVCYALVRMFASSQGVEQADFADASDDRPLAVIVKDSARQAQIQSPEKELRPSVQVTEADVAEPGFSEESAPSLEEVPIDEAFFNETAEGEAVGSSTLRTYYAQVEREGGELETIQLMAPNASRAEEIIRDFRGNPKIVNGPNTEAAW